MSDVRFKSVRGKLTAEQRRRVHQGRGWVQANKGRLTAEALMHKRELLEAAHAMQTLKREREARGLSLAEVARRSGIDEANLARLETDLYPNPTLDTVSRIARVIGVRVTIGVVPS